MSFCFCFCSLSFLSSLAFFTGTSSFLALVKLFWHSCYRSALFIYFFLCYIFLLMSSLLPPLRAACKYICLCVLRCHSLESLIPFEKVGFLFRTSEDNIMHVLLLSLINPFIKNLSYCLNPAFLFFHEQTARWHNFFLLEFLSYQNYQPVVSC